MSRSTALVAVVLGLWTLTVAQTDRAPAEPASPPREPFHRDAADLEAAMVDLTRAVMRDDAGGAGVALARIAQLEPRRFEADPRPELPGDMPAVERAFHQTLDAARAAVERPDLATVLDQQRWMIMACRRCHAVARREGWMAPGPVGAAP